MTNNNFPPTKAADTATDGYSFHAGLAKHNASRMAMGTPTAMWEDDERVAFEHKILEGRYLENLRTSVVTSTPQYITSADDFTNWFESLAECVPHQHHSLFDWLAHSATLTQMKWFLTQIVPNEAGFDDLVAYTQIRLPEQAKLECARNFWDEMGRGKSGGTNELLLKRLIQGLHLQPTLETATCESMALNNTMIGLATTRRYSYHSLGALGVSELTAARRATKISLGMQRLGLLPWVRSYFDLHAALNVSHSRGWIREVIRPLITSNPECAQFIAEGALMRLKCEKFCFDRYSDELEIPEEQYLFTSFAKRENRQTLTC